MTINVRISLGSYDLLHPSETQTQVYAQIPDVARVSYMLPAHFYTSMRDQEWGDVLDNAHGYYESSCAVTDSDSARARAAVRVWLAVDANRDALNAAWFEDRARRDPVSRALLKDVERLRARFAEAVATVARQAQKIAELERIANAERARVAELEAERPAESEQSPDVYPPALPWARLLDDEDLHDFLGDLVSAAAHRWHWEPEVPDTETLRQIEAVCGTWRAVAEVQHAHNTSPGPNADPDDEPVPFVPTDMVAPAVVTTYAEQAAAATLRVLPGGERP